MSAQSPPSTAPQVATTQPTNGATDVSLDVKEIVVTFAQDMDRDGYSFIGGGVTFPKTPGQPLWRDARSCVMPVELSAGQQYVIGINSPQSAKFKSAKGVPATPFTLSFTTRAGPGAPAAAKPAASNAEAVRHLREAIPRHSSGEQQRSAGAAALTARKSAPSSAS